MNPYSATKWQDHIVQKPDTYIQVLNPDGTITLVPSPGETIQQGTPMSATNFNNMENGIFDAHELNAVLTQQVMQHKRLLGDFEGEVQTINLTNALSYPFNDSLKTVSLAKTRDTLNYRVFVEVQSVTAGFLGGIIIKDKALNGFKIGYDGSATAVTLKIWVIGGMYQ